MSNKQINDENFHIHLNKLLEHEGTTFVNHPQDPGGATRYGITIDSARRYIDSDYTVKQLKNITLQEVTDFYYKHFWNSPRINELPPYLASFIFDCAVNHGQRQAIRFLQRSLGINADGVIGNQTLKHSELADPLTVCKEVASRRAYFYGRLSTFNTFGLGWSRRNIDQFFTSLLVKYKE